MGKLTELETHSFQLSAMLMELNWMRIIPATDFRDAHNRFVEIRTRLIDAVFLATDILGAIQWVIDTGEKEDNVAIPMKTINKEGEKLSTKELLDMRLKALSQICNPAVVNDVSKQIQLYIDELRIEKLTAFNTGI